MIKEKDKHDIQHKKNIKSYEEQIDKIYSDAIKEAVSISKTVGKVSSDKQFSFDDYPITRKRVDGLLSDLKSRMEAIVLNGIKAEWMLANDKNNKIVSSVFGKNVDKLNQEQRKKYFSTNENAMQAFQQRKIKGLNLSDRVWNYTNQFKNEIEMGLDVGIRSGVSANEMTRDLKQYLKYPDKLFRRVRDEHGQLHLSKNAKEFHPGRGVYRSSYKNARRLTATETNIAYRTSDNLRWQQMDFVVGIEIHLSNNHTLNGKPFCDICDELAGKYPKDFKFTGWHPHCRCFATSILKTEEELKKDREKILKGEPVTGDSVNAVKDVPKAFKDWITNNQERMAGAKSIPYFISDNQSIVDNILNPQPQQTQLTTLEKAKIRQQNRTPKQIEDIQKRWDERKKKQDLIRKAAANILKVAKDYGEVDYEELQKIVDADDLNKMKSITKTVAKAVSAIKKQEQALSEHIPNVHEWHKQYTLEELKDIHTMLEDAHSGITGTITEKYSILKSQIEATENGLLDAELGKTRPVVLDSLKAKLRTLQDEAKKKFDAVRNRALIRQQNRTPEQIKDIQSRWDERKKKQEEKPINKIEFDSVIERLTKANVEYREVKPLKKPLSEKEIVSRLGGGDLTDGSCSSLAFAYAGNKGGLDVLDFRGGKSCIVFSTRSVVRDIVEKAGGHIVYEIDDNKAARKLLKEVKEGKEYYFGCGEHAAIIRKTSRGFEFLELQDPKENGNGFDPLTDRRLKSRFDLKKSRTAHGLKYAVSSCLIDIDNLINSSGFRRLLGYINTAEDCQRKGDEGEIK